MSKSQTAGWASGSPTPAQLKEFFAQVESGRITKERLQSFLRGTDSQAVVVEEGFITFTTTGRSIREMKEVHPEITIYLFDHDPVLDRKGPAGRRLSVCIGAVPDSFRKERGEQQRLLSEGEFVPKPWDLVDAAIAYKKATGSWPALGYWLRTDAISLSGLRVVVEFLSVGVRVGSYWDDSRRSDIGLAVARKS